MWDYSQTTDWMFQQLPMYQRMGISAFKKDLSNIHALSAYLGNPEAKFKSIHIAGTNGKGSVSHMLSSVFQEAGYKTGLYTSPHLKDFRERIRINGEMISEDSVITFIDAHKAFFEQHHLSFFEMTVGLAFQYFSQEKVDIAVIETGLGGRLDSTNIIIPEVSVITNIGLDHVELLGDTLEKIAAEKAGIIKPNVPVVIGEYQPETYDVFTRMADEKNSDIIFASEQEHSIYASDLMGNYQSKNIQTVTTTVNLLKKGKWNISEDNIKNGLQKVKGNTNLRGRWEIVGEKPKIILDTAHNAEGLKYVLNQLQELEYKQLHIVMGVVSDKDLSKILPLFPKQAIYYFAKPDIPRGLNAEILLKKATEYGLFGTVYSSIPIAYGQAKKVADKSDVIFAGGSNFTVAEII